MIGNYGAGYLPTGAASSPGLYNMALYNQRWLPSWASLKGGIMGPLYTPQITDPATIEAIKNGSWDFPMSGSMFDPQGNYDLVPGAIPNHYYNGRPMTWHGWGSPMGGPLDVVRGFFGNWMAWVSGLSPFWKVVYWAGVAFVGLKALQMTSWGRKLVWTTGIHKLPVVGAVVRKNRGHRKNRKHSRRRRSKR